MNTYLRRNRCNLNVCRGALAAIAIFSLALSLGAQSTRIQTASVRPRPNPAAGATAAAPERPTLDATLFDLQRITVATDSDLADLDIGKWRAGWRAAWLKSGARKREAGQVADSLRRNLKDAVPDLITDVQNSRGSVSTTFKLYNDLNVVVESLDSLIEATKSYGKKGESGPLANDYAALGRLRQDLSSYIQQTAASLEPRMRAPGSAAPAPSSTAQLPKKIVIDDNVPRAKLVKKKTAALEQ
jgi:hypothetical protein